MLRRALEARPGSAADGEDRTVAWEFSKRVPSQLGPYQILGKLGKGGTGSVYKGRDPRTGTLVAVKVLGAEAARDDVLLRRFEREFRVANSRDDPHAVKALDLGRAGGVPYLVLEHV